jgi:hypothetical protein
MIEEVLLPPFSANTVDAASTTNTGATTKAISILISANAGFGKVTKTSFLASPSALCGEIGFRCIGEFTAFSRLARWITFEALGDGCASGDIGAEAGTA